MNFVAWWLITTSSYALPEWFQSVCQRVRVSICGPACPKLLTVDEILEKRLSTETDPKVKDLVSLLVRELWRGDEATEVGGHGHNLSWKYLGLIKEDESSTNYRVVGYGNPQDFPPPYKTLAQYHRLPVIHVAFNPFLGEVFVPKDQLEKYPVDLQRTILKSLQIAHKSKEVRVFEPDEQKLLLKKGMLPKRETKTNTQYP